MDVTDERMLEVAGMLPPDGAEVLKGKSPFLQRMVVSQLARILDYWESSGVVLDPVAFDIVIGTYVSMTVANVQWIEKLQTELFMFKKEHGALPEA